MGPAQLLQWQWDGYPRYHLSRTNLLIHIVAVPLFLAGNIALVVALLRGSMTVAAVGLACMALPIVLEGRGHKLEQNPPEPFTSVLNAVGRLYFEQWITFPRFLLSGGWYRALRASANQARPDSA
jgi:hypothetical protein